jgi:hypothetical protein
LLFPYLLKLFAFPPSLLSFVFQFFCGDTFWTFSHFLFCIFCSSFPCGYYGDCIHYPKITTITFKLMPA